MLFFVLLLESFLWKVFCALNSVCIIIMFQVFTENCEIKIIWKESNYNVTIRKVTISN